MPEELRIVVVDQGGARPPAGPTAPAVGRGLSPAAGGRPGIRPPRIFQPPPIQPPPFRPPKLPPGIPSPSPGRIPAVAAGAGAASIAERARGSRRAIAGIGTARGIAGTAAAGNVGAAASAAAGVAAASIAGPVGIAIAAVTAGFAVAAIAVRKFAQAVESQTGRLAGFSGPLALAQAQTEIGRELIQLRRARRLGPELAAVERLRFDLEKALGGVATEILAVLLRLVEELRPLIESGIRGLDLTADFIEKFGEHFDEAALAIVRQLNPTIALGLSTVLDIIKLMQGEVNRREDDETDIFTQQFMDMLPRNDAGRPLFWPVDQPVPGV